MHIFTIEQSQTWHHPKVCHQSTVKLKKTAANTMLSMYMADVTARYGKLPCTIDAIRGPLNMLGTAL